MPPPVTITDDPAPFSSPGVVYPPQTRTVTPPPWPDAAPWSNAAGTPKPPPPPGPPAPSGIRFDVGPVDPPCLVGCGTKCLIFCSPWSLDINLPGLNLNFPGPDLNFPDPHDPDPLADPKVSPKPTASITASVSASTTSCAETSVATDYFVSCTSVDGKSSSCTTTSTSYATGCKVEATTVTSFAACPSVDPNEDQGEDGTFDACSFIDPNEGQGQDGVRSTAPILSSSLSSNTYEPTGTLTFPSPSTPSPTGSFGLYLVQRPDCTGLVDTKPDPSCLPQVHAAALDSCSRWGENAATYRDGKTLAPRLDQELWWNDGFCGSPAPYFCYTEQLLEHGPWNWVCNDDFVKVRAYCTNATGEAQINKCSKDKGDEPVTQVQLMVKCAANIECPFLQPDKPVDIGGARNGRQHEAVPGINGGISGIDLSLNNQSVLQSNASKESLGLELPAQDFATCLTKGRSFLCKFTPTADPQKSRFDVYSDLEANGWSIAGEHQQRPPSDVYKALDDLEIDSSIQKNYLVSNEQNKKFSNAGGPLSVSSNIPLPD